MSSSSNSLLSLSTRSTRRKSRKSPQRQLEDDLKEIERRREAYFADPYRLTKPVVSQKGTTLRAVLQRRISMNRVVIECRMGNEASKRFEESK